MSTAIDVIDERSEIATVRAYRAMHGHDRASEETKGLIPRGLPRKAAVGGGCRACPTVLIPFIILSIEQVDIQLQYVINKIKEIRKVKSISQLELSARTNMSQSFPASLMRQRYKALPTVYGVPLSTGTPRKTGSSCYHCVSFCALPNQSSQNQASQ